ncbi:hypothetical protein DPMN_059715 [Dreissena polymorpha]|uniref:Uncharacterized protein n=1 Tax=Dreissena polymorpha TaxID=45954 RepID=A0A9D4C4H2_DREPO|nr:hypothetical protein DPMN_059715 [Dreissena polymorpha]
MHDIGYEFNPMLIKVLLQGTYVAITVVCLVMAAVIISLNGFVIFILARQKDNNRLHFFIFQLAIAGKYI